MVNPRFIRCRKCDAVHHVTAFDKVPNYFLSASETGEIAANDWDDFMTRHAGHRLDTLESTGQSFFPSGNSTDPMAIGYIEVTDGKETILLRRMRSSIKDALCFELVPGRLVHKESTLDIQENSLRKEMKLHFPWAPAKPLSDEKIELFLKLYRQVVSGLDARTVCGRAYSVTGDNILYGRLDALARSALMEQCRKSFSVDEVEALSRFIDSHDEIDDVLALVVRQSVTVEERL
jgi:hypothetical protein